MNSSSSREKLFFPAVNWPIQITFDQCGLLGVDEDAIAWSQRMGDADLFLCYSSLLATWTDNAYFRYHGAVLLRDSLGIWAPTKNSTFRVPLGVMLAFVAVLLRRHRKFSCDYVTELLALSQSFAHVCAPQKKSTADPIQSPTFKKRRPISGFYRRHPLTVIYP